MTSGISPHFCIRLKKKKSFLRTSTWIRSKNEWHRSAPNVVLLHALVSKSTCIIPGSTSRADIENNFKKCGFIRPPPPFFTRDFRCLFWRWAAAHDDTLALRWLCGCAFQVFLSLLNSSSYVFISVNCLTVCHALWNIKVLLFNLMAANVTFFFLFAHLSLFFRLLLFFILFIFHMQGQTIAEWPEPARVGRFALSLSLYYALPYWF